MTFRTVTIIDRTPDEQGRFHCFADGGMYRLSIEEIREHVARTGQLDEH